MPKDQDFLLYPIDTGACLACGKTMLVATVEERKDQSGFIIFWCEHCGRTTEKFICE
jgi:transcription elongation factor Elf1